MMKQAFFFVLFALLTHKGYSQKLIEGTWEGKLNPGSTSLRMVLHVKKDSAGYTATMDSPDQGAFGIKTTGAILRGDSLFVDVPAVGGKISGAFVTDTTIAAQWFQGVSFPLSLSKTTKAVALNRPQEPKPPYPYLNEEVVYYNKDKSIQYGATITSPKGAGPFPAMILITGSGQQNRNEELFGHKPFAVMADYLTKQGYVVLRVDDRGIGGTTGDVKNATSKDFALDVMVGLDYLKSRKEVNKAKLGMLGHSEGGMIAQIVAAERPDAAFVISLAGPGQPIIELMREQSKAVLQSTGASAEVIEESNKFYSQSIPAIINAASDTAAKRAAKEIFSGWSGQLSEATVEAATSITDDKDLYDMVEIYRLPWMMYFFKYNPGYFIRKMKAKVLVLNGEKDIQVASKPNLDAWRASLENSNVKKYDVLELKGLNHLFQHCTACTVAEYGALEETMAPEALEAIGNWLKKNVQ